MWYNVVWLIFSLKGFYSFFFESKTFIRDNMVWPILSFQGSYINVYLTLVYFLVLKIYWKIVSGTAWFGCCFPFQGFYQVFIKGSYIFFCFKSLYKIFWSSECLNNVSQCTVLPFQAFYISFHRKLCFATWNIF